MLNIILSVVSTKMFEVAQLFLFVYRWCEILGSVGIMVYFTEVNVLLLSGYQKRQFYDQFRTATRVDGAGRRSQHADDVSTTRVVMSYKHTINVCTCAPVVDEWNQFSDVQTTVEDPGG